MTTITKTVLVQALTRMGALADASGIQLELCLYGGALMMRGYDARAMTKDVDGVIQPSREGMDLARRVGQEMGLPYGWLNDDVKVFTAPFEETRKLPWEAPGIMVTAPTAGYLLAMKALACRDPLPGYEGDLEDVRFLIGKMNITSVDEVQEAIDKYYPNDVLKPEHRILLQTLMDESTQ